jgi:hypothetical protein
VGKSVGSCDSAIVGSKTTAWKSLAKVGSEATE